MSLHDRRAEARRRAWGRGPVILRFEPLEGRALMASSPTTIIATTSSGADTSSTSSSSTPTTTAVATGADLVATSFGTQSNLYWGDAVNATGTIANEGTGTATAPFEVAVYATTSPTINANSVLLGTINLPGGLAPGASTKFSQNFFLPAEPLSDIGSSPSFSITLQVDPMNAEGATSLADKQGLGQGIDTSVVTITPDQQSNLVGDGFSTSTTSTTWGSALQVSAVVQNTGLGNAPATTAEVVATPSGDTPGGINDVALGSIAVPALPTNQSIPVQATIALPANAPLALAGSTQFTLSLVEDTGFVANPIAPHLATQGTGLDSASIQITAPATTGATLNSSVLPRPDLSVASVVVPTTTLIWGQTAQIQATVANTGSADAGSFQVLFLLANASDPTSGQAQVLGSTTISSLKAGDSQTLLQTVRLPATIGGVTPPSTAQGTILVEVNPDHSLDESSLTNNGLASNLVNLALDPSAANTSAAGGTSTTTTAGTTTTTAADGTTTTTSTADADTAAVTTAAATTKSTTTTTTSTTPSVAAQAAAAKRLIVHQAEVAVKATHQAEVVAARTAHQAAVATKLAARKAAISLKIKTTAANIKIHQG